SSFRQQCARDFKAFNMRENLLASPCMLRITIGSCALAVVTANKMDTTAANFMATDSDLLARARKYDRRAIETLFGVHYPVLHRMSMGLAGRADVGAGVVRFVIKQALQALPKWKDDDAPQRWFL